MRNWNRFSWFLFIAFILSYVIMIAFGLSDRGVFGEYLINHIRSFGDKYRSVHERIGVQYLIFYTSISVFLLIDKWIVSPKYYNPVNLYQPVDREVNELLGIPVINVPCMILVRLGSCKVEICEIIVTGILMGLYLVGICKIISYNF